MIVGFPHRSGFGGPGSFQSRFEKQLIELGHEVCYAGCDKWPDIIVIIGGTNKLKWLYDCRRKGIPIVYRLDGINWLHTKRGANQRTFKGWFRSEFINLLQKFIHRFLADHIVYQSDFVHQWWDRKGWVKKQSFSIIRNGVNLGEFCPIKSNDSVEVICLEGYLDYSPYAIDLINELDQRLRSPKFKLYGGIRFASERKKLSKNISYEGVVKSSELPSVYRNSIYFSLDTNAACPNTVIEALASGAPVVGYDTGALKELVGIEGGIIVPFGQDAWDVSKPSVDEVVNAISTIYANYEKYSRSARALAEREYSIEEMVGRYLKLLETLLEHKRN